MSNKWEELSAVPSLCSCCDFVCSDSESSTARSGSKVKSLGWHIGQNNIPEKNRMDFQAQGRAVVDQKQRHQEREEPNYKTYKTFLRDIQDDYQEKMEVDQNDKPWNMTGFTKHNVKERRLADVAGLEAVPVEMKHFPRDTTLSDKGSSNLNKTAPSTDNPPYLKKIESSVSNDNGGRSTLKGGFKSTFARGFSNPPDLLDVSMSTKCAGIICNPVTGTYQDGQEPLKAERRALSTLTGLESFSTFPGETSPSGEGDVQLATSSFQKIIPVFSEVRVSKLGGLELSNLNSDLWSEEKVCFNRSDNTSVRAVDSLSSEEYHQEDFMIRGNESIKVSGSKHLICLNKESDFDQSTDGSRVNKKPTVHLDLIKETVLFGSELKDEVNSDHSTIVTFSSSSSDPESSRQWPEVLPEWDMQSFKVVVKQSMNDDPSK